MFLFRRIFSSRKVTKPHSRGNDEMEPPINFVSQLSVGALASVGADGSPQVATIFFTLGPDGSLVFKSRRASDHMKSLPDGEPAAISAYTHTSTYIDKSGIQLKGVIREIVSVDEMKAAIERYSEAFAGAREKFLSPEEHIQADCSSTLFKFVPTSYKLLDPSADRSDLDYMPWGDA